LNLPASAIRTERACIHVLSPERLQSLRLLACVQETAEKKLLKRNCRTKPLKEIAERNYGEDTAL
jgi:hypothetical protein